jgi:hypothetical protein
MNQTVTLLLLLSGGDATPAERQALATFQRREKVVLSKPAGTTATVTSIYPSEVVTRVEAGLEEAQRLAAALDEERALELLAGIERELIAHPELPQAAWLLAERYHVAAAIRRNQPDGAADAAQLVASARVLEGPRAEVFGERTGPGIPEARTEAPTLLSIRDLDRTDVLVIDGKVARASENLLPGRHHVRVLRDSHLAWAGWLDVPAEPRVEKLLGVPERLTCSKDDLADVTPGGRAPNVPYGVHCGRWVAVRRGATGLEVAWCEGARCTAYGPLLREQLETKPKAAMPAWLAATIVGAATVGAASLLIATGTFERERPPPVTNTVYQGPR